MSYEISQTLSLELCTGDDPHLAISRKGGGLVRIELRETVQLLAALIEATLDLSDTLLQGNRTALVQVEGEDGDEGFILPFPCTRCGDGVVFVSQSDAGEWSMRCDGCGHSWAAHNLT